MQLAALTSGYSPLDYTKPLTNSSVEGTLCLSHQEAGIPGAPGDKLTPYNSPGRAYPKLLPSPTTASPTVSPSVEGWEQDPGAVPLILTLASLLNPPWARWV